MEEDTAIMDSVLHSGSSARDSGDQVNQGITGVFMSTAIYLIDSYSLATFWFDPVQMQKQLQMFVSPDMESAKRHCSAIAVGASM